jgi:hypothetical protein
LRNATACESVATGYVSIPSTTAASRAFLLGQDHARHLLRLGEQRQRERALDLAHAPVERQLAGDQVILVTIILNEVRPAQQTDRDRQIERRPSFFTSAGARLIRR